MGNDSSHALDCQGEEYIKFFVWRVLVGDYSHTGDKVAVRGLASEIYAGCKAAVETVHHLFWDCPCLNYSSNKLCS